MRKTNLLWNELNNQELLKLTFAFLFTGVLIELVKKERHKRQTCGWKYSNNNISDFHNFIQSCSCLLASVLSVASHYIFKIPLLSFPVLLCFFVLFPPLWCNLSFGLPRFVSVNLPFLYIKSTRCLVLVCLFPVNNVPAIFSVLLMFLPLCFGLNWSLHVHLFLVFLTQSIKNKIEKETNKQNSKCSNKPSDSDSG